MLCGMYIYYNKVIFTLSDKRIALDDIIGMISLLLPETVRVVLS